MKKTVIVLLLFLIGFRVSGQLATFDAQTAAAVTKSNVWLAGSKALAEKSFASITDLKKSGLEMLKLTKEYQDALSTVNSYVRSSEQAKDIFQDQQKIIAMYANNTYKYDRYFSERYKKMVHTAMKSGLKRSFQVMRRVDVILSPNFLKMTDGERFQQLDKISKDMNEIARGMRAFIDLFSRYAEALKVNPDIEDIDFQPKN